MPLETVRYRKPQADRQRRLEQRAAALGIGADCILQRILLDPRSAFIPRHSTFCLYVHLDERS